MNLSVSPSLALEAQNRPNSTRMNKFCVRNLAQWGRRKTATYQWSLTTHQTEGLWKEAFRFSNTSIFAHTYPKTIIALVRFWELAQVSKDYLQFIRLL